MTVIIAYKTDDEIYLGTDSMGVAGHIKMYDEEKICRICFDKKSKSYMYVAVTGPAYVLHELQHGFIVPLKSDDITFEQYLHRHFVPKFIQHLSQNFLGKVQDGQCKLNCNLVIIYDNIYVIYDNMITVCNDKYYCDGQGADLAQGALYAMEVCESSFDIEAQISIALDAACYFSTGCGGINNIVSIKAPRESFNTVIDAFSVAKEEQEKQ